MGDPEPSRTDFASLLEPENIICRSTADSVDSALRELLERIAWKHQIGHIHKAFTAIKERLADDGVTVAPGVAMPHARLEGLEQLAVAISTNEQGVRFGDEEKPAHLIILILAPKDDPALYLDALGALGRLCAGHDIAADLREFTAPEQIHEYFKKGGVVFSANLTAGHMMEPDLVSLKDTQTLEDAINIFTKHNLMNLPVVDRDDELVGVVTAYELLRVCLPDYILWMDDVSPIMNFEPFANVLRHETNTWLAEIMSMDYAVVSEDAPAIEVAKEITKHKTRRAFVVRGKKLVGSISLQRFLNLVFRE